MGLKHLSIASGFVAAALAFGICARAQDNMRGAPYNGYTGVPFDTTNASYDYLVDSSLKQDDPANKKFTTGNVVSQFEISYPGKSKQ